MRTTPDTLIPRAIANAVQPAVQAIATRLFYLTTYRPGSKKYKPSVLNLYETTFAHSIYEHLLMDPTINDHDIRHEFKVGKERVDLWMRNAGGGPAHFIEVGLFTKKKVEEDLNKLKKLKPGEKRWMLALFRGATAKREPKKTVSASLRRENGLDNQLMTFNKKHSGLFKVYRPGKESDSFGYAVIKGI